MSQSLFEFSHFKQTCGQIELRFILQGFIERLDNLCEFISSFFVERLLIEMTANQKSARETLDMTKGVFVELWVIESSWLYN